MLRYEIIKEIKYYIYILVDPSNGEPFYIGKGKSNRVFDHIGLKAKKDGGMSLKNDRIKKIYASGSEVDIYFLRHGISDESVALEIEAVMIDFIKSFSQFDSTNIQYGHKSSSMGLMTLLELNNRYKAEDLKSISNDCMIININKKYPKIKPSEVDGIYNATKELWCIDKRRLFDKDGKQKINYVLSEYKGLILAVFKITRWNKLTRPYGKGAKKEGEIRVAWSFDGKIADSNIRNLYLGKSIAWAKKPGDRSEFRYSL